MTTREESVAWVWRALTDAQPAADPTELTERAEGFVAIAEENRIRVDDLITWIHCRMPGKEWSLAEFRRFAAKLQQLRNEIAAGEPL